MPMEHHEPPSGKRITVEIAGLDLDFQDFDLDTKSPTGGKIANVFGFTPDQAAHVMQWRDDGELEALRVQEEADLGNGRKFIVAESDSTNRISIDGEGLDWPSDEIAVSVVRKLGRVPADRAIYLERTEEADRLAADDAVVKIKTGGVEQFRSGKAESWELNVQGKKIVSEVPVITAASALSRAGFDPNDWIIILKVAGQPKRQLAADDEIDLRAPGIEKIRLTAKDVNNGEVRPAPLREFALLEDDESHLDSLGLEWETRSSDGHRWLLIRDYPVPEGFTAERTTIALMLPPAYPQAEIDMFYVHPHLRLSSGAEIPATQALQTIGGLSFQRWSRHRGSIKPWNPRRDNVVTHLALVESALLKEADG